MGVRTLGWIVLLVGALLLLVSPVFDHPWEEWTDAVTAGAVMVLGLALVIFARPTRA